jgi:adenylate kinase family enzyme
MKRILVTGAPGSGKSTTAVGISRHLGIMRYSTGDIAQSLMEQRPDVGVALARGGFAPRQTMDEIVLGLFESQQEDIVVDGYPRYRDQLMQSLEYDPIILFVHADPVLCMARLTDRGREDHTWDRDRQRLSLYVEETYPLLLAFLDHGNHIKAHVIDGSGSTERMIALAMDALAREGVE